MARLAIWWRFIDTVGLTVACKIYVKTLYCCIVRSNILPNFFFYCNQNISWWLFSAWHGSVLKCKQYHPLHSHKLLLPQEACYLLPPQQRRKEKVKTSLSQASASQKSTWSWHKNQTCSEKNKNGTSAINPFIYSLLTLFIVQKKFIVLL